MVKAKRSNKSRLAANDSGLFHAVWETAAEAMALYARDGTVLQANPAFLDLIGLTREEAIGRNVSQIFAGDFGPVARARFAEQFDRPDSPFAYETNIKRLDGQERVLDVRVTFLEEDGRRVAMLATGRDVTERQRLELALRRSEETYRTLVQHVPNGSVLLFDRNLTVLIAGGAGFSKLGVDPQEMIGKAIYDALSPDVLKQVAPACEAALEGKTTRLEITPRGEVYEVQTVPTTDEQGAVTGGMVLAQDITERKRSEEVTNRLAAIVESTSDAIIGKTLDGTIYSWNSAAAQLYGYSADEIVGRSISILIPADRPYELRTILEQVAAGERVETYDTVRIRKDGSKVDISLSVSPILDASGQISGASTIARDITERKIAQRKLEEHAARQLTLLRQLTTAQEAERRRLAMDLHDGPLQSLAVTLMALDRARERAHRGEPELAERERNFARQVLTEVVEEVRATLADLSSELLAERGLAVALLHHTDLVSEASGVKVQVDDQIKDRLPLEIEVLLYRLAQEAIANARKHAEANSIAVKVAKEGDIVYLWVIDDGKGFDVGEGLQKRKEGSGLGLGSMQQRIQAAWGDMTITSQPGKGTKLEFWCPISMPLK